MIDWDIVLSKAIMWGVLGAIGGVILALFGCLNPKAGMSADAAWEARERARIEAQLNPRKRRARAWPVWLFLIVIIAIIVGVFVAKPELLDTVLIR